METQVMLCAGRLPNFILGFLGPKSEAVAIKTAIGDFLRERLSLEMSPTKTLITHARTDHALFLSYAISIAQDNDRFSTSRSRNGRLRTPGNS